MGIANDLASLDATAQADLVRKGDVTSAELVEAFDLQFSISWVIGVFPHTLAVTTIAPAHPGLLLGLHRAGATSLPEHLADTVNAEDFADFLRALADAAAVMPLPVGGRIAFTKPG